MEVKMKYVCNEPFWKFKKLDGNESYCKVCKKNVVDFRRYSEKQLSEYKPQNPDHICGIFTNDQAGIDTDTVYGASVYKIVLASLISFFAFSVSESKAQMVKDSVKIEQHPVMKGDTIQKGEPIITILKGEFDHDSQTTVSYDSKKRRSGKILFQIGRLKFVTRFPFIKKEQSYAGTYL
jgi:hypothetical protein